MANFFIHRPVFAWVIALLILLGGFLALRVLPIEQYPNVAPPSLEIAVVYPGADAATLDQNVTQVIEQELNGVPGYLYMASTSRSNGTATITLTFEAGTSLDVAQVNVQNRMNRVESRLPEEVRRQGINITESSNNFLMIVALTSKSGGSDSTALGNIASNQIIDELRRVPGVGDITLFGTSYAMRIWLDPDKLATYNLAPSEALRAVQEQNSQTAGGAIGDQPNAKGNDLNATIITQNRFTKPEQFQNIILKANPDGSTVTLADVGRVELGSQDYLLSSELSGKNMAGMGVKLRPGANALATAAAVKKRMEKLGKSLPSDVAYSADSTDRRNAWTEEVAVGIQKRRRDRCGRPPLRSPGRPSAADRSERQLFWTLIAAGLSSGAAAIKAGVSQPVGTRWFRKAGGMPPAMFRPAAKPLSGRYLSLAEREDIALLLVQGHSLQEIGRRLGRSASTISREVRRNATTRSGGLDYRATVAQWHAERSARRPKATKLAGNAALRSYVEERLAGIVRTGCGNPVPRPAVSWKGRRHGPRQDRRWAWAWSPEQIARRLAVDFPNDETMRISHEAIYQTLFVQGRGALRRELTACLRTGRTLRKPRARVGLRGKNFVSSDVMISQRPAEADDRAVPGHWEGDLILGLDSSAIGTLVERTTRFTMLLHLPRMEGHGDGPTMKNGPALAGHGAEAVRHAIARTITTLPQELRRSLTWDQGAEMAQHARLKVDTGVQVYFCDPQSPWQRGSNENTNGLLRQYFPKGTDLSAHSPDAIAAVAATLNARPRKTLGWKTPAEALDECLSEINKHPVATTG